LKTVNGKIKIVCPASRPRDEHHESVANLLTALNRKILFANLIPTLDYRAVKFYLKLVFVVLKNFDRFFRAVKIV